MTDEKNVARSRMLVSGTRQNRERYKKAKAAEKIIHRRVKTAGKDELPGFVILDGLKQGDTLSSLLFNIAPKGAIRRAGVQGSDNIVMRSHMLLGFVGDVDIIGIDRRVVEEALVPFKRETARIGLTINTCKRKCMIAGRQHGSKRDVGSEVLLGGERFETVEAFIYLGTLVTCDNDVTRKVKRLFTGSVTS